MYLTIAISLIVVWTPAIFSVALKKKRISAVQDAEWLIYYGNPYSFLGLFFLGFCSILALIFMFAAPATYPIVPLGFMALGMIGTFICVHSSRWMTAVFADEIQIYPIFGPPRHIPYSQITSVERNATGYKVYANQQTVLSIGYFVTGANELYQRLDTMKFVLDFEHAIHEGFVVKPDKTMRWISVLLLVLVIPGLVFLLVFGNLYSASFFVTLIAGAGFVLLAYEILLTFRQRLFVKDDSLSFRPAIGSTISFSVFDITKAQYPAKYGAGTPGEVILFVNGKKTARISSTSTNFLLLLDYLNEKDIPTG